MRPVKKSFGSYTMYVHITGRSKRVLDWVHECIGVGSVKPNNNSHGSYWRWQTAAHKDIIELAEKLHPYAVEKKRRWELLYHMGINMRNNGGANLTNEIIHWRDTIFAEFHSLQSHQPVANGDEFGGHLEQTIPSQALKEEGVEVSPEITDISVPLEREDMTRATQECVEVEQR
jgi:hypothetical protein